MMTNAPVAEISVPPGAAGAPFVVGLGGTLRPHSSTERLLRECLAIVDRRGGRTQVFCGKDIDLPMYNPQESTRTEKAARLIAALRTADAVVVASPGYHGAVSGLVKNALDYVEDLRDEPRTYLDSRPLGCIAGAYGWQAAIGALNQLRSIGHALRAWPTPLGVAINTADKIWGERGDLADETVAAQIEVLADQVLWMACAGARWARPRPSQAGGGRGGERAAGASAAHPYRE